MKTVSATAEVLCIYKIVRTVEVETTVSDDATEEQIETELEKVALAQAKELTVDTGEDEHEASDTEIEELTVD